MSRFKDRKEQQDFIVRSNAVLKELIISKKTEKEKVEIVEKFYSDWNKIFTLPPEKNPMDSIAKNEKNIEKVYKELVNSIELTNTCPNENISTSTIQECIESLNTLKKTEKYKKSEIRILQYQVGMVAVKLQTLTKTEKNFKTEIKKQTGYSYSYARFLIQLYKACNRYAKLVFTAISTMKLRNNFPELKKLMENDLLFWSPPGYAVSDVSTVGDVSTTTTESSMSTD